MAIDTNFLSALGAGSGIDSKALATSLATAEIKPKQDIVQKKIKSIENKISGYGVISAGLTNIKSALQALENPSGVLVNKIESTNTTAFIASASTNADTNQHTLEVIKLAQGQRTFSSGFTDAESINSPLNNSNPFTLQLSINGGESKTIRIPAIATSPSGIVTALNNAKLGLQASLINTNDGTDKPYKIIITGPNGAAQNFTLLSDDGSGIGQRQRMVFGPAQSTGSIKVAGVSVAIQAGDSSAAVAAKVRNALAADSLITGFTGRSVTDLGDGSVQVTYAGSDGKVDDIAFTDTENTGVQYSVTTTRNFTLGNSVSGINFSNDTNQVAQDAEIKVDGITIKRDSNKISDVIRGVTLNLKSTTSSTETLSVIRDTSSVKDKVAALIKAYNDTVSDFGILSGPKNSKDETDVYSGSLQADSIISSVQSTIRELLLNNSNTPSGSINALRDIGVSITRTGTLELDTVKLDNALSSAPNDVVTMLTANKENKSYIGTLPLGLVGEAIKRINALTSPTGQIASQKNNASNLTKRYQDDLKKLDDRLTILQTRYAKQFAAMDSFVGSVNSQKSSLKSSFEGIMAMYTKN